jgi:hypothetical protein
MYGFQRMLKTATVMKRLYLARDMLRRISRMD